MTPGPAFLGGAAREGRRTMISKLDERQRTLLRSRVNVPRHVVYRDFPVETVVLNLQTEKYHGLNPTAGRMLAELDRLGIVQDAAKAVAQACSRPQHEVELDICDLCDQLLERGLIELTDDAA